MSDTDAFEARFRSAYLAYVTEIPSAVDARAIAQTVANTARPWFGHWTWPVRRSQSLVWLTLVVLTTLALLAALVLGSRRDSNGITLTVVPGPLRAGVGPIAAGTAGKAWTWNWESIWHLGDGSWTQAATDHAINVEPWSVGPGHVRKLYESADGTLWADTFTTAGTVGHIRRLDSTTPWWNIGHGPGVVGVGADGSTVLAGDDSPVWSPVRQNEAWDSRELAPATQLATGCLSGVTVDGAGSVWLGSAGRCMFQDGQPGLARYRASGWEPIHLTDDTDVRAAWLAVAPDGSVWVATLDRSLAHLDGDRRTVFSITPTLPNDWMNGFAIAPDGSVLMACDAGLARFDGASWSMVATGAPVYGVDVARDGAIWLGGSFGAARITGSRLSSLSSPLALPSQ